MQHRSIVTFWHFGSIGRRSKPYDNANAGSFLNTIKVEEVYPMAYETFADVAENLQCFIDEVSAGLCRRRLPAVEAPNTCPRGQTVCRRGDLRHHGVRRECLLNGPASRRPATGAAAGRRCF